jgi:GalNAc-alpha-(1->4)-GalNAc-alpha-(1->3)-diNAcBac-PP-undecaprenol alpha-1,4-N-acetyl-D-galactosaminyltransferase
MRITTIIGGLTGGGAERVCVNLANAWVARGREVTILTYARSLAAPAYAIDPKVQLRDIGWPRGASYEELNPVSITAVLRGLERAGCFDLIEEINIIAMLRYAILETAPDLVVAHIDMTNVRVLAAMLDTNVPVIACEHTDLNEISLGRWQDARQALYRHAVAVVASHKSIAEWLRQRGANAYAIPNPLAPPPRTHLDQNGMPRRVVTLGRLSEEKRPALLVRAFSSIAADFPEWDLEICGVGPLHEHLARLIKELAPGRIHLRGFVRDHYAVLNGADLFVSSSWVEGFGNAIWEALACGVPVVAMDGGPAVRSLVRDGVDGLIVTGGIAELASALSSLMGDGARRKALAERATEVLMRFPFESSLEDWDVLLNQIVGRTPAAKRHAGNDGQLH